MNKNSIGVFDSGVGGLSVLKEIIKILPNEDLIYFGDSKNSPFGLKSGEEIVSLSRDIANFLMEKKVKAIVIACNTATAAALDILRKEFDVPIIGVISAGVKVAAENSENNKIGVIGTPFTINSNAYGKEFIKKNLDVEVYGSSCPELCPMIEIGWGSFDNREEILKEYLSILPKDVDTLILGCTHYPLIKKEIKEFFPGKVVDPAKETALELKKILIERNLQNNNEETGKVIYYSSGDIETFKRVAEKFLHKFQENIEILKPYSV